MRRRFPTPGALACFVTAWPSFAAGAEAQSGDITGVTNLGVGVLLISIAAALLLTLLFRASATRLAAVVTARLGKRKIRKILAETSANVLDDFILPGAYGGLTHIDHAVLTSGGILCIQTKHYNGIVFGNADDPQWTNVDGVHKRKFLNPLIQNEGRSKALMKIMPDVPVANLVVFTGAVQFASPLPKNVIHIRDLRNYIALFVFGPSKIDDWDAVWLTLRAAALTDEESRKDFSAQLSFS
ncbi:MAG TPA: nuclease-related domain-containing protein [Woeseiaceae bacterium]|nr:nuclease-related domain-containing protein [Woeseiaceae bacterium]